MRLAGATEAIIRAASESGTASPTRRSGRHKIVTCRLSQRAGSHAFAARLVRRRKISPTSVTTPVWVARLTPYLRRDSIVFPGAVSSAG